MVQISSSDEVASSSSPKRCQNKCKACGILGHSQNTCGSSFFSSSASGPFPVKVSRSSKQSSASKNKKRRTAEEILENRYSGLHFSGMYKTTREFRKWLTCRFCGQYPIKTFCQQCNVGLCQPSDSETIGCFQTKYHDRACDTPLSKKSKK